jgi:hypothetical protein
VNPAEGHASRGPHAAVLTAVSPVRMPAHPSIIASPLPSSRPRRMGIPVQVALRGPPGRSVRYALGSARAALLALPSREYCSTSTVSVATHPIPSQRAPAPPAVPQVLFAPYSRERRTDRTSSRRRRGGRDERTTPGSGLGAREAWPTASTTVQKNKTKKEEEENLGRGWSTRAGTTSNSGAWLEAGRFAPASTACFIIGGPGLSFAAARAACNAGKHCKRGAPRGPVPSFPFPFPFPWQWAAVKTAACLCRLPVEFCRGHPSCPSLKPTVGTARHDKPTLVTCYHYYSASFFFDLVLDERFLPPP